MSHCNTALRRRALTVAAVLAGSFLGEIPSARADIIWSEDFTGDANAFPTTDFTGNSTPDWSTVTGGEESMLRVNTSVGDPAPSLVFTDNNSGTLGNFKLAMTEFATFSTTSAATPILRLSFDWKIESFSSGLTTEAFRFILRANNSTASGDQLILGFNRATFNDGDGSTSDLAFYAATVAGSSNIAPSNASAIGLISGTGWQPGFNFGEYDFGTSSANDTDDLYYHFDFGYNYVTGAVNGTVTRKAPDATNGQSAAFAVAMNPNLNFSNGDANDVILWASTNGVTGVTSVDNIVVESVPEPASVALLALGALGFVGRRRCAHRA